jgi:hypothetical protein
MVEERDYSWLEKKVKNEVIREGLRRYFIDQDRNQFEDFDCTFMLARHAEIIERHGKKSDCCAGYYKTQKCIQHFVEMKIVSGSTVKIK